MYTKDLIIYSFKGLLSKKSRYLLTVISILIGIISVIVISAIGSSGQAAVNSELDNLGLKGITIKSKKFNLTTEDTDGIRKILGKNYYVSSVLKDSAVTKYKSQNFNSVVFGGEKDILNTLNMNILYGRGIRDKDIEENKCVAVITKSVSERIFGVHNSIGMKFDIETNVKPFTFTVVGVVDNSKIYDMVSDNIPVFIYIPVSVFSELYPLNNLLEISVVSKYNEAMEPIGEKVISFLENKNSENNNYYYENLNTYKRSIEDIVDIITFIVTFIGAVSLLVGGISVMNTMLITVNERKSEIGLKKAIGFTNFSIMAEFFAESLIIIVISCILGIATGILIAYLIVNIYGISLKIEFVSLFKSVMFAFVLGGLFGIYPAYKASYVDPVESLKS